ncbi:MAG: flagellar hook-basal body complex protein FliE [Thermoleophilia bacterium]|nr:flagellar hook-basal body complex protein FliE [Thermoleophilia bacterium]
MAGLGGISSGMGLSAAQNPLAGLGAAQGQLPGSTGGTTGGSLDGMIDGGGLAPTSEATSTQGSSFSSALKSMVIDNPSKAKAESTDLAARFAAGENIDPQQLAVSTAKAGVEIQMATRTISSAVSSVRTLFQMQV